MLLPYIVCLFGSVSILAAQSSQVQRIKLPKLQQIMYNASSTLTIVNFWATWCKPCVKEIPYFQALDEAYSDDQVQILLISLDPIETLSKVSLFVKEQNLSTRTFLLDEKDQHSLIDSIHKSWDGALPYTLFIKESKIVSTEEGVLTQENLFKKAYQFL